MEIHYTEGNPNNVIGHLKEMIRDVMPRAVFAHRDTSCPVVVFIYLCEGAEDVQLHVQLRVIRPGMTVESLRKELMDSRINAEICTVIELKDDELYIDGEFYES